MTIKYYGGLPGAGKSYNALENFILPALIEGRAVYHNLELYPHKISEHLGKDCSPLLHQFPKDSSAADLVAGYPGGASVVIDEAWNYWRAGSRVNNVPEAELAFFKEHRHGKDSKGRTTQMLLIDQDAESALPRWLRRLIAESYLHYKLSAAGQSNRFRVEMYSFCQDLVAPSQKHLLRRGFGTYKPELFELYRSHTHGEATADPAIENEVDQRANVWRTWSVKSAIASMVITPLFIYWGYNRFLDIGTEPEQEIARTAPISESLPGVGTLPDQAERSGADPANAQIAGLAVPPDELPTKQPGKKPDVPPRGSDRWTLIGVIVMGKTGFGVVETKLGQRRIPLEDCTDDGITGWYCEVDGRRVYSWSGNTWRTAFKADPLRGR